MAIRKTSDGNLSWIPKGAQPQPGWPAGWYEDADTPGIERYWTGSEWHAEMQPRPKPTSALNQVRIIALGILVALAAAYFIWNAQGPSDEECQRQAFDVTIGARVAVESGCR